MPKILIIRFSSIGDIVWTTPVVRGIKQQLPQAEVHFCTKKQYSAMVDYNPYIDKVHCLEDSLTDLIKALKTEQFDYVIDLHRNLRSRIIKWRLGAKSLTYNKHSWQRWLLITFKINRMPGSHVADWHWDTVKSLGVKPDGRGLDFFIPSAWEVPLTDLPLTHQGGYVALVIGATEWNKRLPHEKLIALCEKIARPIVLIGGKEDNEQAENLVKAFAAHPQVLIFNTCGKYNISRSASLVRQAQYVFGHDTGLTHIAAAFDKKIYAIYGSTVPNGFAPYAKDAVILENNRLDCRPCSKSGRSYCPKGHFKCMKELNFEFELTE
jgi:ADP-heptose:LPS heptosyltransferase